jgi:spore coat protein CotH
LALRTITVKCPYFYFLHADNHGEAFPLPPWKMQLNLSSQTGAAQPGGMQMQTLTGSIPRGQHGPAMQPKSSVQIGHMPMQNGQPGFLQEQQMIQGSQPAQYGMFPQKMATNVG